MSSPHVSLPQVPEVPPTCTSVNKGSAYSSSYYQYINDLTKEERKFFSRDLIVWIFFPVYHQNAE